LIVRRLAFALATNTEETNKRSLENIILYNYMRLSF